MTLAQFSQIWLVDFEFIAHPGENPDPVCLVARELRSGREAWVWREDLVLGPPWPTGPEILFVAYYASAEIGCLLELGWPIPERILDLFTEFRRYTNGLPTMGGASLLGALGYFGIDGLDAGEKAGMRDLVIGGGPWSAAERKAIFDYCASDVAGLARLLPVLLPHIDVPLALLGVRYMAAAARMERCGVPTDTETLERLRLGWDGIKDQLIREVDQDYGVFDRQTFKRDRFADWLTRNRIPWPLLDSGQLDLTDRTFREMSRVHPRVAPLRELRSALSDLRLSDLAVGRDGRNRTLLSAFRARTARNQPSNSRFIFGPSTWLRGLIKPPPGHSLAYIDWAQQEFGIAAALSGDTAMLEAYRSGDPYLAFARKSGAVPPDATKESHPVERDQFKACALGVQYGLGAAGLAQRIGQPVARGRHLLEAHRETYSTFWRWSDAAVDCAMLHGHLDTVFGWTINVGPDANPRSLRNFPMQSNGAEILRLGCIFGTELGVSICAPVHDAVLVCASTDELEDQISMMRKCMARASEAVLGGFELCTYANIVHYPDRYMDEKRGKVMWGKVVGLLGKTRLYN